MDKVRAHLKNRLLLQPNLTAPASSFVFRLTSHASSQALPQGIHQLDFGVPRRYYVGP